MNILSDKEISRAVSNIVKRSERQDNIAILTNSFVDDIDVLEQIDNNENQIMFGRRGTGKTHVLKVLQNRKDEDKDTICLYIDMRTLGSTNQFIDKERPLSQRCYGLFKDLISEVHDALLNHITNNIDADKVNFAFEELTNLSNTLNNIMLKSQEISNERQDSSSHRESNSTSFAIDINNSSLKFNNDEEKNIGTQQVESVKSIPDYNFTIPSLNSSLKRILDNAGIKKFYLLIDEWSGLDVELHPFFAEFIKKTFLPLPKFVVKIASLEYRSVFFNRLANKQIIGFELGGDIAADINLDDYYVYDKNPYLLKETFAKLLVNHLSTQLEEGYLKVEYNVTNWIDFQKKFFTSNSTFAELVRAAEGVPRDLINIFSLSYFNAKKAGVSKIELQNIEQAARHWYQNDKAASLSNIQTEVLNKIVDDVIGHRNARAFLLEQKHVKNEVIRSLFDSRVIHQLQKSYSDQDTPGVRFDIYILDYGTYVDLKRTSRQLEMNFSTNEIMDEERIVPFNDKRSIRRVILNIDDINIS